MSVMLCPKHHIRFKTESAEFPEATGHPDCPECQAEKQVPLEKATVNALTAKQDAPPLPVGSNVSRPQFEGVKAGTIARLDTSIEAFKISVDKCFNEIASVIERVEKLEAARTEAAKPKEGSNENPS